MNSNFINNQPDNHNQPNQNYMPLFKNQFVGFAASLIAHRIGNLVVPRVQNPLPGHGEFGKLFGRRNLGDINGVAVVRQGAFIQMKRKAPEKSTGNCGV